MRQKLGKQGLFLGVVTATILGILIWFVLFESTHEVFSENIGLALSDTITNKSTSNATVSANIEITSQTYSTTIKIKYPLDINKATKDELMSLDGIGSVFASRIINYRVNKPFGNIKDIKNISGIGDAIFENIKDFIFIDKADAVNTTNQTIPSKVTTKIEATTTPENTSPSTTIITETSFVNTLPPIEEGIILEGNVEMETEIEVTETISSYTSTVITEEITTKRQVVFPINLNTATVDELKELKGIGDATARNIVSHRDSIGGFYFIEEIKTVSGIGDGIFNNIKSQIYVDASSLPPRVTTVTTLKTPTTTATVSPPATSVIVKININTATATQLETIPGISSELAYHIIMTRDTVFGGKYTDIAELIAVQGMTKEKINKIYDYIYN